MCHKARILQDCCWHQIRDRIAKAELASNTLWIRIIMLRWMKMAELRKQWITMETNEDRIKTEKCKQALWMLTPNITSRHTYTHTHAYTFAHTHTHAHACTYTHTSVFSLFYFMLGLFNNVSVQFFCHKTIYSFPKKNAIFFKYIYSNLS